jgi:transposase
MSRALSDDLRSRVLAASADGMSARSAAARFGIGISTAIAWIANARQGQLTAGKADVLAPGWMRMRHLSSA